MRYNSPRGGRNRGGGGPPGLVVLLLAVALVFGVYYVWQGVQTFLRTGGLGVVEATERAQEIRTATAAQVTQRATLVTTLFPTATPPPSCTDFRVIVPAAIVREGPSTSSAVVTQFTQGTMVCVLSREADPEWYSIDLNPSTRRIELGYMNEVLIEADNPTLTPSITPTASNTVTPAPTVTPLPPTETPRPLPSYTRNPQDTNTPLPTLTLTPTPSATPPLFQSA